MKMVYSDIYVGTESDYGDIQHKTDWSVVHACKEPWHRAAIGYTGRGAPKDHPDYLVARRGPHLTLNMVDCDNPEFIAKEMIDKTLDFIAEELGKGRKVLIHSNMGVSRAPSIALLYMAARLRVLSTNSLEEATVRFRLFYPKYRPKRGIRGHLKKYWREYCTSPAED